MTKPGTPRGSSSAGNRPGPVSIGRFGQHRSALNWLGVGCRIGQNATLREKRHECRLNCLWEINVDFIVCDCVGPLIAI